MKIVNGAMGGDVHLKQTKTKTNDGGGQHSLLFLLAQQNNAKGRRKERKTRN
jgi:hypothetical protein